jgi:diaminopimelate decarboxylase/aspartate kinase
VSGAFSSRPTWVVLKFGGTSVSSRPQWDVIAGLARARLEAGHRVLVVCSAVAGVTNRLTALADRCERESGREALAGCAAGSALDEEFDELLDVHRALGAALGVADRYWLAGAATMLQDSLAALRREPDPPARAALVGSGEWLSTRIGTQFLVAQGLPAAWVDAREALEAAAEHDLSPARQWLSAGCAAGADRDLQDLWAGVAPLLVTQGFVARSADGRTALLGRGGSDTSAALLAGRLAAERVEIWTDVPGLFTADPRLVAEARLLGSVDYDEALEMAASGARVVHPRAIRAAAETRTPMWIRDTNHPQAEGTCIGAADAARGAGANPSGEVAVGVKTVTCQPDMAVMLLQNLDARRQVGFLADVFDVFRRHGVSIDLVATSETTTTVALNKAANHLDTAGLGRVTDDLERHCTVQRFDDCVCVNLVGRGARKALGRLAPAMAHFEQRPLLMVSQSANDLCLSLLVPAGEHGALLRSAHEALIPASADGVFGLTWDEIRSAEHGG